MDNGKGMLYHYTRVSNIRSIFHSNELWFTNIRRFKDAKEYLGSLDVLCNQLRLSEADQNKFIGLFESERSRHFVLCLSDTPDNNHLIDNYGPVSLEIDGDSLLSLVRKATRDSCITGYLNFRKCEYDFGKQKEFIKSAMAQWTDSGKTSVPVEDFSVLAVTFKDVIYSDEAETRLILKTGRNCPTEILLFGECKCQSQGYYKLYLSGGISQFVNSIQVRGSIPPKEKLELEDMFVTTTSKKGSYVFN